MPVTLNSDRLLITEWDPQDWVAFCAITSDPEVMKYIGNGQPWSAGRTRQFVLDQIKNSRQHGFCLWKLADKSTGALMGFCGLQHLGESREIEIGWWLAKSFWGHGRATEAARTVLRHGFEALGLQRIVAIAQPAHQASIRIMDKLGMRYQKNTVDRHGVAVVLYSIENHLHGTADPQ